MKGRVPDFLDGSDSPNRILDELNRHRFPRDKPVDFLGLVNRCEVVWAEDGRAKNSKHEHKLSFTNYLHKGASTEILHRLNFLKCNLQDIVAMDNTSHVGGIESNDRLRAILKLYLPDSIDPYYSDYVYKVSMKDAFGASTSVRVYGLYEPYELKPIDSVKYRFSVFLIDPWHLVIPSAHKGVNTDKYLENTYRENRQNRLCLSNFL